MVEFTTAELKYDTDVLSTAIRAPIINVAPEASIGTTLKEPPELGLEPVISKDLVDDNCNLLGYKNALENCATLDSVVPDMLNLIAHIVLFNVYTHTALVVLIAETARLIGLAVGIDSNDPAETLVPDTVRTVDIILTFPSL